MRNDKLRYTSFFVKTILVIVLIMLACAFILSSAAYSVSAEEISLSSGALSDLRKDPSFDITKYKDNQADYSVQVIQIAESTNKELVIYTYQPAQRTHHFVATCVNMSLAETASGTNLYNLELLSEEGVFCKYKVKDVFVADTEYRYYNITSIYRAWKEGVDASSGNDNTKNEVAYNVGKLFKASTIDGKVTYTEVCQETIEIVNPYVDYLRYSSGFWLATGACDSHYIAFDTDKQIDTLMEAKVYFKHRTARSKVGTLNDGITYGPEISETKELTGKDKGETLEYGHPWFTKKFEWDRIQSVDEFKKTETLKPETIKNLDGAKWVLRFYETTFNSFWDGMGGYTDYTDVSDVSILRLKFMTNGKLYDLGAVSSKVSGDNIPGGGETDTFDPFRWLKDLTEKTGIPEWGWILIIVLIILAIAAPILALVFPVVGQAIKALFKFIVWLVSWLLKALIWLIELPFKAVIWLVQKITDKGGGGE